jgi:hypothetical protein
MDSGCLILCRKLYFRRDKIYSQLQLHYSKGNYFYFIAVKPIRNALDLSLSKKFLEDQLTLSIYVDDVLNSNENAFNSYQTLLLISTKMDTRKFGFSLNYKIPTKNKLAKENPNLLNKDKKEDSSILNQ